MQCKLKIELLERREPQYALAARVGISETRCPRIVQSRADGRRTPAHRRSPRDPRARALHNRSVTKTSTRRQGPARRRAIHITGRDMQILASIQAKRNRRASAK